jgi:integrase
MSKLRFVLRTDHEDKDGLLPVQLIYQIAGQRKYYYIGEKLREKNWDADNQIAIYLDKKAAKKELPNVPFNKLPTAEKINEINSEITALKKEISKIETRFNSNDIVYSPTMVINALKEKEGKKEKREERSNVLYDYMEKYLEDCKETREPGSLTVYRTLKKHLQEFQKQRNINVTFENISYQLFVQFQKFLIRLKKPNGDARLNNITIAKQLSTLKTFLNYARTDGYKVADGYKDFKIKKETLEVIALTNDEFERLYNLDLTNNKKFEQVRDAFCFSCVTGLRYSDLKQLSRDHIKSDEIKLTIQKTKEIHSVPLTPISKAILKKYEKMKDPFPMISNQKMNMYLKGWDDVDEEGNIKKHHPGICELAKIDEPIEIVRFHGAKRVAIVYPKYELVGVHTGRKTFATLSLERGMSISEVMSCTGHRDYKSFSRYVKITEERKKVVMAKAWGSVKETKLKAV